MPLIGARESAKCWLFCFKRMRGKGTKRWRSCIFAIEKNTVMHQNCAESNANTQQIGIIVFIENTSILLKKGRTPGSRSRRMTMEKQWNEGWPKKPGWYKCLVDGDVEMELKFYVCQVSCKPHWVDKNGDYIETQYKVKWKEK